MGVVRGIHLDERFQYDPLHFAAGDHEIWGEFFQKVMARFIILGIDVMDRKIMRCCDQLGVAGAMHHQCFDLKRK